MMTQQISPNAYRIHYTFEGDDAIYAMTVNAVSEQEATAWFYANVGEPVTVLEVEKL